MSANIEKVITLSPVEARAGVSLRLENQVEKRCPTCRGGGERAIRLSNTARDTIECEDCEGFGVIDALETIEIKIEQLNGNRDERKFVYDGLGNYSRSINTRGDLIVRVKVDRICVEDEDRDFTVLSYGDLENFDEKFDQEQNDFRREFPDNFPHDTDDFKQQQFWAEDFEDDDENDDLGYEDEIEENSGEIYAPLMQMATPELYEKNTFRLLGISPGISEREAKRTLDKIQKLRRTGISISNPHALLPIAEVDDEEIEAAGQILLNAEERFLHEFFWIFPASLIGETDDESFLTSLQQNDLSSAIEVSKGEVEWQYFSNPPRLVCSTESLFNLKNSHSKRQDGHTFSELTDLAFAKFDELLAGTEKPERNGWKVRIDAKCHERLRRTIEEIRIREGLIEEGSENAEQLFSALFLFSETVNQIIQVLREKAHEARKLGYSSDEVGILELDAQTLEDASLEGNGEVLVYIYPSILSETSQPDRFGYKLHNLAILSHICSLNDQGDWKQSYFWWNKLYEMTPFWQFLEKERISQINNPLVRASTIRQIRENLPRFLLTINAKLAVRYAENGENELAAEHVDLVRNEFADEDLGQEILLEIAQPKKAQIEHLLNHFEFEIEKSKEDKNILIKEFLGKTEKVINVLKVLLGEEHPSIVSWGSKITRAARSATVKYGNETEDWRECLSLNSFLLRFPCNSKIEEQIFDDQRKLTNLFVQSEIETLCEEAVEACDKDILQTPTIVKNFLVGCKNLVKSLELDYAISTDWADPAVRIARSLMIEYANETGQWQESLALQSKLLELPCSAELKKQLAEDEQQLAKQIHQKEITDLLDQAIESSKEIFPPAPLIVKDLLIKCQKILDKKSKELGAGNDVILELKEIIYQVANGLLIKYVNEKEDFARTLEVLKMLNPFAVTAEHQKRLAHDIATLQKNNEFYSKTVRCWFCQENKGDEVSNIKVPMYGDVVRNRLFNRTEVTWRNAEVTVPRCLSCDAIHLRKSKFTTKGVVIGGLFGFLINLPLIFIYADYFKPEMVWLAAIVIGGFVWLGFDISREASRATQSKQTNDIKTKYQHPLILELQAKGWSVGERPSA